MLFRRCRPVETQDPDLTGERTRQTSPLTQTVVPNTTHCKRMNVIPSVVPDMLTTHSRRRVQHTATQPYDHRNNTAECHRLVHTEPSNFTPTSHSMHHRSGKSEGSFSPPLSRRFVFYQRPEARGSSAMPNTHSPPCSHCLETDFFWLKKKT